MKSTSAMTGANHTLLLVWSATCNKKEFSALVPTACQTLQPMFCRGCLAALSRSFLPAPLPLPQMRTSLLAMSASMEPQR